MAERRSLGCRSLLGGHPLNATDTVVCPVADDRATALGGEDTPHRDAGKDRERSVGVEGTGSRPFRKHHGERVALMADGEEDVISSDYAWRGQGGLVEQVGAVDIQLRHLRGRGRRAGSGTRCWDGLAVLSVVGADGGGRPVERLPGHDIDEDEIGDGHSAGMDRGEGSGAVTGPGCANEFRCARQGDRGGEGIAGIAANTRYSVGVDEHGGARLEN
jgi:hypothetical protein